MAETHQLNLKIDATAAQRGSSEFVAAINAVKRAVASLEKDSAGAFKKLKDQIDAIKSVSGTKIALIDKKEIVNLTTFAAKLKATTTQMKMTRITTHSLREATKRLASGYTEAGIAASKFTTQIARTNNELRQQIDLANRARAALTAAGAVIVRTPSTRGGTNPVDTQAEAKLAREEAMRNRVTRAIDNQRSATISLMAQLARVGGTGDIQRLEQELLRFQGALSGSRVSVKQLDDAQTRLNTSQKAARVTLTTFNAQIAEQRASLNAAADAARAQAKAFREMARAANAASSAQGAAGKEAKRLEALQLQVSKSLRTASRSAESLTERLKNIGNVNGIVRVQNSLHALKAAMNSGVTTTAQLRAATNAYEADLHRLATALTRVEGAQRRRSAIEAQAVAGQRNLISNARQIEREMRSIQGATNATGQAWRRATGNMRGLENAFNATYQAGTIFRNLLGTLTLGTFISSVYKAGSSLEQFMVTMEVATGTLEGAASANKFVDTLAAKFGTNLRTARQDFAKFAVSAELSGASTAQTRDIFESVSMALSVMGKGAEDQRLSFLALEQMMSKGTVSSEELRRQLGERLPGAVNLMAKALNVTTGELQKMLKAGSISSVDALPKFAKEVTKAFGPGMEQAIKRASNNLGTFQGEIEHFTTEIAQSGFMNVLAVEFAQLTRLMRSSDVKAIGQGIGQQLAKLAQMAGDSMEWIVRNADAVRKALLALAIGFAVTKSLNFINFFVTAGFQLMAFVSSLNATRTAQAAAAAATNSHTIITGANTGALTANQIAALRARIAQLSLAAAHGAGGAAASLQAAQLAALRAQLVLATGAAGGLAATMGWLSRGLAVIAPILGILAVGFLMIPGAMDSVFGKTDRGARRLEMAVRRSGIAFDDLGDTMESFKARSALDNLISDLDALNNRMTSIGRNSKNAGMNMVQAIMAAQRTTDDGLMGDSRRLVGDLVLGTDSAEMNSMMAGQTSAAKKMSVSVANDYLDVRAGISSALELHDKLSDAMNSAPSGRTFFGYMLEELRVYTDAERALIANRDKLVLMSGTQADKDVMGLSTVGKDFLGSGDPAKLVEMRKQAELLLREYENQPEVIARIEQAMKNLDNAVRSGQSLNLYAREQQKLYTDVSLSAEDAVARIARAQLAQDRALNALMGGISRTRAATKGLRGKDTAKEIEALFQAFRNAPTVNLDLSAVEAISKGFAGLSPAMNKVTKDAQLQFKSLQEGDQTYRNLDQILEQLAATYPALSTEITNYRGAISHLASNQDSAAMSAQDLYHRIDQLNLAQLSPTAEAAAMSAVRLALGLQDAGLEAAESASQLENIKGEISGLGKFAEEAAASLEKLKRARQGFSDAGGNAADEAMKLANSNLRERRLLKMPEWERSPAEWLMDAQEAINAVPIGLDPREDAGLYAAAMKERADALAALDQTYQNLVQSSKLLYDEEKLLALQNKKGKTDIQKLMESTQDYVRGIDESNIAIQLQISGQVKSAEAADLLAQAIMTGDAALVAYVRGLLDSAAAATEFALGLDKIKDHQDAMKSFGEDVIAQSLALELLITGQARTTDHAEKLAAAMLTGDAATIQNTKNILANAGALETASEKMQKILDLRDAQKEYQESLAKENLALQLVIEGRATLGAHADMLADAMLTGNDATIAQTESFLEQAKATELLTKKLKILAADPVKDWLDAVPTWTEAGQKIETQVFDSLSDSIADMIKTGEFSFKKFGEAILGTAADVIADMAVKEMMGLFGMGGETADGANKGKKAGFGLGGILQNLFGFSKGSVFDPANGGIPTEDATAMAAQQAKDTAALTAAQTGAGMMQQGIIAGAQVAAQLLQAAMSSGAGATTGGAPIAPQIPGSVGLGVSGASQGAGMSGVLNYAQQFIGMSETADNASLQKLLTVDPAVTAWCADFVNQTLKASGMEGTGKLNAKSFLNWGEDASANPQIGDVAVYDRGKKGDWQGHTGFISGFNEDGSMQVLGGNQSNAVTEQRMGPERLLGIRRGEGMTSMGGMGGMGAAPDMSAMQEFPTRLNESFTTGAEQMTAKFDETFTTVGDKLGTTMQTAGDQTAQKMGTQIQTAGTASAGQMGTQVTTAGMIGGTSMGTSVTTSGQQSATAMQQGIVSGGAQAAGQMQLAVASGGGAPSGAPSGGGGGWGGIGMSIAMMGFSAILGKMGKKKEKEEDDGKDDEFNNAQSYARGTHNTSGIPAILHPNEAVIPLTKGRKVPVDMGDMEEANGGSRVVNQTFHITTPDADSFRRSQKQTMADAASAGQRAMSTNR